MELVSKNKCSGCSACFYVCEFNAITFEADENGFSFPSIDSNKCVECNKCIKVCHVIKAQNSVELNANYPIAFAVKNCSVPELMQSSSGGVFIEIAKEVINKNGVVFGAMFNAEFDVIHSYTTDIDSVRKFMKSKYVESRIGDSYSKVKMFLEKGRYVLFTGTPCQVNGLIQYLDIKKIQRDKLITIDFICHGVPSTEVWRKYIDQKMKVYQSKIIDLNFRDKTVSGWVKYNMKIKFENGEEYSCIHYEDPYMRVFLNDLSLRESCYSCSANSLNRKSDITIADFWGGHHLLNDFDEKKGCSLVLLNNKEFEFSNNKLNLDTKKVDFDLAIKHNKSWAHNANRTFKRDIFMRLYKRIDFVILANIMSNNTCIHKFIRKGKLSVARLVNR